MHVFLFETIVIFASAVVLVPIARRAGLGSEFGYLIGGVLIGPHVLALVHDPKLIFSVSQVGVVLMLFIIGLSLDVSRLWKLRRSVLLIGGGQVLVCGTALAFISAAHGTTAGVSAIVGVTLAFSSTAFTMQLLRESNELKTEYGEAAFSVLLFQDLVAIPLLAILPLFAKGAGSFNWLTAAYTVGLIAAVIVGGRYLLRPLFRVIARERSKELFTMASLLVIIGVASVMEWGGLSMGLGAFMAGVLFADSEYRHELEMDIEPFKGLLLGLFFIAIGMSVQLPLVWQHPYIVTGITGGVIITKFFGTYFVGRLAKMSGRSARNLAFATVEGGEFAFVIFAQAAALALIPQKTADFYIVSISASMLLAPILWRFNHRIFREHVPARPDFDHTPEETAPRVIVAGFGRVGQIAGRLLRVSKVPFTALELNPDQVTLIRRFGATIFYGDASRLDLLESAGARTAQVFFLAIGDYEASMRIVDIVQKNFPHLRIIARARNRKHALDLMEKKVELINRETLASSLEMAEVMFLQLGFDGDRVERMMKVFRQHDEQVLREQFRVRRHEDLFISAGREAHRQLEELLATDKQI